MRAFQARKPLIAWSAYATLAAFLFLEVFRFGSGVAPLVAQERRGAGKKVAIFVLPATAADVRTALLLNRILRENVRGLSGVELVTPAPVRNSDQLPLVQAAVDEAYRLVNAGQVNLALARLMEIKPTLDQILPMVPVRTLAVYYKCYGVAMILSGNAPEGRKALEISLMLWREQTSFEYAYSVEVVKTFTEVQGDIQSRSSAKLRVVTQPDNALVIVGNREPTQSPAMLANLVAGPQYVRVAMDGYEQFAGFRVCKANEDNVYSVALTPIAQKDEFEQRLLGAASVLGLRGEQAREGLAALKRFLLVDEILVLRGSMVGDSFDLSGFHVKGQDQVFTVKRTLPRDAEFLPGVREFLSGMLEAFYDIQRQAEGLGGPPLDPVILQQAGIDLDQTGVVFDPDNPVFPTVERTKRKEGTILGAWWFWVGVGVVVAGGVAAGFAVANMGDEAKVPSGDIQINISPLD